MGKLRLRFSKRGRIKYISHLDLMRTFQRSFMRSGIRIKHTEGFNPHAYISIALPLKLGCESLCEVLDIDVLDDLPALSIPERLNKFLPEGIKIISADKPINKPGEIKYLRFRSIYTYDEGVNREIADKLKKLFERSEIVIIKKTKRGQSEFDLKPCIEYIDIKLLDDKRIEMEAVVSAQNPTVNPSHLLQAVEQLEPGLVPSFSEDMRIEIYDKNMKEFR